MVSLSNHHPEPVEGQRSKPTETPNQPATNRHVKAGPSLADARPINNRPMLNVAYVTDDMAWSNMSAAKSIWSSVVVNGGTKRSADPRRRTLTIKPFSSSVRPIC